MEKQIAHAFFTEPDWNSISSHRTCVRQSMHHDGDMETGTILQMLN